MHPMLGGGSQKTFAGRRHSFAVWKKLSLEGAIRVMPQFDLTLTRLLSELDRFCIDSIVRDAIGLALGGIVGLAMSALLSTMGVGGLADAVGCCGSMGIEAADGWETCWVSSMGSGAVGAVG